MDECAAGIHHCSQVCTNLNGTYSCSCLPGFTLSDGQSGVCKANDNKVSTADCEILENLAFFFKQKYFYRDITFFLERSNYNFTGTFFYFIRTLTAAVLCKANERFRSFTNFSPNLAVIFEQIILDGDAVALIPCTYCTGYHVHIVLDIMYTLYWISPCISKRIMLIHLHVIK